MAGNLRSRARAKALMQRSLKLDSSDSPLSPTPERCNSAEEAARCAICLGEVADLSYSNMCLHKFCYGCLVEWSKIKPECPLCKTTFTSIYHNVRSNDDYDEYHVPPVEPAPQYPSITEIYQRIHQIHDDLLNARRTHRIHPYGPTAISQSGVFQPFRRSQVRIVEYLPLHRSGNEQNPFSEVLRSDNYRNDSTHGTSVLQGSGIRNYQNRRRVYDRDQWVQPLNSPGTSRRGPSSVQYIQTHVGSMARAKSFLYRELTVLMGLRSTLYELASVYDTIMNVLEVYDVRSREFHDLVTGYLGDRTRHFQHELYYFLLSGLALDDYDSRAAYTVSGQPSADVETRLAPIVVDLEGTDDEQANVPEIDCIILPDETASTARRTRPAASAAASASSDFSQFLTDGPWDLTVGGETLPQTAPVRNEPGSSSSSVRISDLADRRTVLPNDYSTWEERRNQDRLHAIFQDSYSNTGLLESSLLDNPYDIDHAYSSVRLQRDYVRPSVSRIPTATVTSSAAVSDSSQGIVIENVTSLNGTSDSGPQAQGEDDDCVLVGVQPVIKKPPLAVITISDSDDEVENDQISALSLLVPPYKNEVPDPVEDSETDDFLESFTNRASSTSQLNRGNVGMETTVVESIPLLTWETWNEFASTCTGTADDTAMPGPSSAIRIVEYSEEVDVGSRHDSSRSRSHRSRKKSTKAKRKRRHSSTDNDSPSSKRKSSRKSSRDSYNRSKYSSETTADQASESETGSRSSSPDRHLKSKKRSKQKHKKSKHRSDKSSKKKSRNKSSPPSSDSSDTEGPRESSSRTVRTHKASSRDSERGRR